MGFIRIFRTPKHSKFDYNPMYWNPEKEDLQERLESVEKSKSGDPEALKARIGRGLRHRTAGASSDTRGFRSRQVQKSNKTLVIVLIALMLGALLLLFYLAPVIQKATETTI